MDIGIMSENEKKRPVPQFSCCASRALPNVAEKNDNMAFQTIHNEGQHNQRSDCGSFIGASKIVQIGVSSERPKVHMGVSWERRKVRNGCPHVDKRAHRQKVIDAHRHACKVSELRSRLSSVSVHNCASTADAHDSGRQSLPAVGVNRLRG